MVDYGCKTVFKGVDGRSLVSGLLCKLLLHISNPRVQFWEVALRDVLGLVDLSKLLDGLEVLQIHDGQVVFRAEEVPLFVPKVQLELRQDHVLNLIPQFFLLLS